MITTTTVRMAVARLEFTPSIPIFAKIDVKAANTADPVANQNHAIAVPLPAHFIVLDSLPSWFI